MSFPALFLACQAAEHLPPLDDEEFGLTWTSLGVEQDWEVRWALYRSEGAGLVFGVLSVEQHYPAGYVDPVVAR